MIKAPERVEIPEDEELRRDRFARILALLIVVATLGVASVEYLHSRADKSADAAGVEAQVLSVQRQGDLVRTDDGARANVDNYAWGEQQRTEQANAFQEYLAPSVKEGSSEATVLQDEEARWQQLASLTDALTPVKPGTPYTPQSDIRFPNEFLAKGQQDANRLFALQDADNQLRSDWLARSGQLAVVLTMLAVAIYLFGLSLTLQARVRRWLVGLGVVLVVVGLATTAGLQLFNPSAPSEEAAGAYSQGMYALDTFYTQSGDQGLRQADAAFTRAIDARPRFAQAYLERSLVRFLLGSPTPLNAIVSITTPSALQQQGDDLQQAYNLGLTNKELLNDLAANRLLLAITQHQSGDYSAALGYLKSALQLDPNDPLLYYNQGLAYLGEGNVAQAAQSYSAAVHHTLYLDAAGKTSRNDPTAEENYVAGALTPLDLLAQHRSDLSKQVTSMKELIVNGVDRHGAPISSSATVTQLALDVFPGELQWTASMGNYNTSKDSVSTEWYYEDPHKLGWSDLPAISGPQTPAPNASQSYANPYFVIRRYLEATSQCLQPGHYKAEVYIDGHLAGTATGDGTQPSLQAQVMPEIALDFCEPNGWRQSQANFLRGFSNGFTSSDGSSGGYFVRFQNPQFSGTDQLAEADAFREEMISLAVNQNMLPSGAGTPSIDCGTQQNGTSTLPWGPSLNSDCTRQGAYFLGLKGANEAWYTYNGGVMHIGSGIASDGAVVIAFTFGPDAQWSSQNEPLPDSVFDSIVSTQ